jgi:hypothetical protein
MEWEIARENERERAMQGGGGWGGVVPSCTRLRDGDVDVTVPIRDESEKKTKSNKNILGIYKSY